MLSTAVKHWSIQWFKAKRKKRKQNPSSLTDGEIDWSATSQYRAVLKSSVTYRSPDHCSLQRKKQKLSSGKFSFPPVRLHSADAFLLLTEEISRAHIHSITAYPSRQIYTRVWMASSCWIQQFQDERTAPRQSILASPPRPEAHFISGWDIDFNLLLPCAVILHLKLLVLRILLVHVFFTSYPLISEYLDLIFPSTSISQFFIFLCWEIFLQNTNSFLPSVHTQTEYNTKSC